MRDPFDIKAVEKNGRIPVTTFVGREEHRGVLRKTIENRENSISLIVGEKGIGKTSLGNVVRADLFERYFTPLLEIDCQANWTSKDFLLETLSTLYENDGFIKTFQGLPEQYVKASERIRGMLFPLFQDEASGAEIQVAGFGGGRTYSRKVARTPLSMLKAEFRGAIKSARDHQFRGIALQYNNLDNLSLKPEELAPLFSDLRDFLLTDNAHFIFLGGKAMEAAFKTDKKVNECISADVQLGPLSAGKILRILAKRYDVLKIPNRLPAPPVRDDAVKEVCALFDGNIRQVFYSLHNAVANAEQILGQKRPLNAPDLSQVLYTLAESRLKESLQPRALEVLYFIIENKGEVTNSLITRKIKGLRNQNTSKYLRQLKNSNLIIETGREGRNIYYKAVHEARWLLFDPEPGTQTQLNGR